MLVPSEGFREQVCGSRGNAAATARRATGARRGVGAPIRDPEGAAAAGPGRHRRRQKKPVRAACVSEPRVPVSARACGGSQSPRVGKGGLVTRRAPAPLRTAARKCGGGCRLGAPVGGAHAPRLVTSPPSPRGATLAPTPPTQTRAQDTPTRPRRQTHAHAAQDKQGSQRPPPSAARPLAPPASEARPSAGRAVRSTRASAARCGHSPQAARDLTAPGP